jgi:hypothetical protein
MSNHFVNDPKHWYDRGAEMRVLADLMRDDEAKAMMLKLATDYDKLGDRAVERGSEATESAVKTLPP